MNSIEQATIAVHQLKDDGAIPNNPNLPLLIYKGALVLSGADPAAIVEQLFERHGWANCWRNGIYPYHHYHSTAHEVLGVYCGSATVQLGGEHGITESITAGDVIVIPAGVGHKNCGATGNFGVVGAYPRGLDWDMRYGKLEERAEAMRSIASVPLPNGDPVYGEHGPLSEYWLQRH